MLSLKKLKLIKLKQKKKIEIMSFCYDFKTSKKKYFKSVSKMFREN